MRLNSLKPGAGAHKDGKRAGRGIGSGLGKTGGRGHKGQKSRSGGFHKVGFEGGQMPLQRRLPKFGFHSRKAGQTAEVRLNELAAIDAAEIDILELKKADIVGENIQRVRVILSGKLDQAVVTRGLAVTRGARAAIEAAGGRVE